MTTQQDQKARQLYELGYRPAAIADQLRVATCDVRRSLRRTRPNRPPPLTPAQQAARELAAEGYDRDAIRKVFGGGATTEVACNQVRKSEFGMRNDD